MSRPPRVLLIDPSPPGVRATGNRVTADRWAGMLQAAGCKARLVGPEADDLDAALLVALHARKSAPAVARYRAAWPDRPVVVALTGTDVYPEFRPDPQALAALQAADRIVALQPDAVQQLPVELRGRATVIRQSVGAVPAWRGPGEAGLDVVAIAHLREVKDPLLAARAVSMLPATSQVRIEHLGAALEPELAARARDESKRNPRWSWNGELDREATLARMAAADLLVSTSRVEGGGNAVAEAVAIGLPVVAARAPGLLDLLGPAHPGWFDVGDAAALAALLVRAEAEAGFLVELARRGDERRDLVDVETERRAWRALVDALLGRPA